MTTDTTGARGPVFILDCDNTLLDNDKVKQDMEHGLRILLGAQLTRQFWKVYESVRTDTGTVDFPATFDRLQRFIGDERLLAQVRALIMEYPFASSLYPDTISTLGYLTTVGTPTIVSDGDQVYQPLKISNSGLRAAVNGRVLVFVHKEDHLEEIFQRWPASHYVLVDDKARILAATKVRFPDRFLTVHVRQGHYGREKKGYEPAPDVVIDRIGALTTIDPVRFSAASGR